MWTGRSDWAARTRWALTAERTLGRVDPLDAINVLIIDFKLSGVGVPPEVAGNRPCGRYDVGVNIDQP